MVELDRTDRALLALLQRDARRTNVELAEAVSLSPSACLRRLQRLERSGAIRGYRAMLDPSAVGRGLKAFVRVQLERHDGLGPDESIHQACLLRLRPILMTTVAAILGAVPLLIGGAEGAEMRQPLGLAIIGGLVLSQLLTLYTTPVVYLQLDRLRHRFNRWRGVRTDAALETPL